MHHKLGLALFLGAAVPLLMLGTPALGGDGVAVNITNDGIDDIVVTVYDMTLGPGAIVLSHTRISGFTTIPLSVAPDASGKANVAWTAVTTDSNDRKCGHAETVGLGDYSSVQVHADSNCAVGPPAASAATLVR
jgi:hypothetical protein